MTELCTNALDGGYDFADSETDTAIPDDDILSGELCA